MQNAMDQLMAPLFGAFMGVTIFVMLAVYVYTSFALMTIAKKTKTPNEWLAWIPIANLFLITQIGKVPWWTVLIVLIAPVIQFFGLLIMLGVTVWWWWRIAEERKKPGWMSLLMLVPIVNLIIIGVLAWSD